MTGPRLARAVAVAALAVPAMLLAHLLTAGQVPAAGEVLLVALVVVAVTATVPAHRPGPLAAVVGTAQTAGQLLLVAHRPGSSGGCLPAVGRGAEAGLRLTLLRHDSICPNGTLAVSPTGTAAATAILTALAVLLGHTLVALLAATITLAAETTATTVRALRALTTPTTPAPVTPPASPRALLATPRTLRPTRSPRTPRPAPTRGPPRTASTTA